MYVEHEAWFLLPIETFVVAETHEASRIPNTKHVITDALMMAINGERLSLNSVVVLGGCIEKLNQNQSLLELKSAYLLSLPVS